MFLNLDYKLGEYDLDWARRFLQNGDTETWGKRILLVAAVNPPLAAMECLHVATSRDHPGHSSDESFDLKRTALRIADTCADAPKLSTTDKIYLLSNVHFQSEKIEAADVIESSERKLLQLKARTAIAQIKQENSVSTSVTGPAGEPAT